MRAAIDEVEDGMTIQEVSAIVEAAAGRPFTRTLLEGKMRQKDFIEVEGRWYRSEATP